MRVGESILAKMRVVKLGHSHQALHVQQSVEFPTVDHFIEDIASTGIETVRLDTFEEVSQSELSFVYYVTLTLFVTAYDPVKRILYEFVEPIGTTACTEMKLEDDLFTERAQNRIRDVELQLGEAKLTVLRGRYSLPNGHIE